MIEVYTDGSFDKDGGRGGWAFVVYEDGLELFSAGGGSSGLSNNTFEIMAVLNGATWATEKSADRPIVIWSDSLYVAEGLRRWLPIWRNNGWKKIDSNTRNRRRASPDREIWQALDQLLLQNPSVTISWCKAHQGVVGNERADAMATEWRCRSHRQPN